MLHRSFQLVLPVVLVVVGGRCVIGSPLQEPARQRSGRPYPPVMAGARTEIYKTIGDVKLTMYIFEPDDHMPSERRPAIVFFFGGGWRGGSPIQFREQCAYLASRGMVAVAADYRVRSRHGTRAVVCVADAKSAVRWIRANAKRLGVDPGRIVAGGGSAGGHIAACAGVIKGFEESGEDTSVSSVPDALVLFNPVVGLAPVGGVKQFLVETRVKVLTDLMGVEPIKLSPYHGVERGAPPTIIFHGRADTTVPYRSAEYFAAAMKKAGNRCRLFGYEDQGHGFFNHGRGGNTMYRKTVREMDEFLIELGYLSGKPTIDDE